MEELGCKSPSETEKNTNFKMKIARTSNDIIAGDGRVKFTFENIFVLFLFFQVIMILSHCCLCFLYQSIRKKFN